MASTGNTRLNSKPKPKPAGLAVGIMQINNMAEMAYVLDQYLKKTDKDSKDTQSANAQSTSSTQSTSNTETKATMDSLVKPKTGRAEQKYVSFWRETGLYGEFSQWYPSKFVDSDGITYANNEQYMMYKKAMLFDDLDIAAKIMKTTDPKQIKSLGRRVKNFVEKTWCTHREEIVYNANYYKFSQNPKLKKSIMSKSDVKFVEASPTDRVWGIGYDTRNAPKNFDNWGLNLLGLALDKVRDKLLEEETSTTTTTTTSTSTTATPLSTTIVKSATLEINNIPVQAKAYIECNLDKSF
jgi:hypothetical protein